MNKKQLDLHVHSLASDGTHSVKELIDMASKSNLKAISITDHDTLLAYKDFPLNYLKEKDLNIVPGIELSGKTNSGSLHILGYGLDYEFKAIKDIVEKKAERTIYSLLAVILALKNNFNISIPKEEISLLIQKEGNVGRPHIAKILIKQGIVSTVREAFDKYLNKAKDLTRDYFPETSSKECIEAILNSGGIPVLAHPKTLPNFSPSYLETLIKEGLMGIEIIHSSYTKNESMYYKELANKYSLITSGGSDFHGKAVNPKIFIGTGELNSLYITNTNTSLLNYLSKDVDNFLYFKG